MTASDTIIAKIAKLLALSKSPNEHEAALALQKAKELMEIHSIAEASIRTADVTEARAGASVIASPSEWEMRLEQAIRSAFGCTGFFQPGSWEKGEWVFVGVAPAPAIAAYAFKVLYRQAQAQRRDYVASLPKRLKPATKRNRGNLFALAWVSAVQGKVGAFAGQDRSEDIAAWIEDHHPDLVSLHARDRNRKIRRHDASALIAGRDAGRNARLDHAIGGAAAPVQIGRANHA